MSRERVLGLLDELDQRRGDFMAVLGALPPGEVERPLLDSWTARDLVWHCGFWSEHGAEAVELAAAGRGDEFRYDSAETDAINASEAEVGRRQEPSTIAMREEAAYARFREALSAMSDDLLDLRLGNGDTVEDVIRYDGPDHYAEHAAHLRRAAP